MELEARPNQTLIGESASFQQVMDHVSQVAPLSKPVLVIGERGTGKELVAARVHYLSARWDQAFLKLNCAALPESLLESDLFGHEAGAFTGATKARPGRFERANRGSLFLDELASMSLRLQEKLLRILEYGEYERLGGSKTLQTDVRLIAAANTDLPGMAKQGTFREDLLDRLSFDVITLPPLRARQEDIPLLADYFALGMVKELKRPYFPGFSEQAMQALQEYAWPGNVRELRNVIERAVYRAEPDEAIEIINFDPFDSPYRPGVITGTKTQTKAGFTPSTDAQEEEPATTSLAECPVMEQVPHSAYDFKQHVQEYETGLLEQALKANRYNQKKTAHYLGLTYNQLRGYLRKYQVVTEVSESGA